MTKEQIEKMTDEEMDAYVEKSGSFDESQSLKEYTEFIRDCIYICKILGRKWNDSNIRIKDALWADSNKTVKNEAWWINKFYSEGIPASETQMEIEYGCG